jgi:hypothetical protein
MNLPLGTAGSQLSHRRCRTDDLKFRGAEETYDLVDDAKLGKPARGAPLASRRLISR